MSARKLNPFLPAVRTHSSNVCVRCRMKKHRCGDERPCLNCISENVYCMDSIRLDGRSSNFDLHSIVEKVTELQERYIACTGQRIDNKWAPDRLRTLTIRDRKSLNDYIMELEGYIVLALTLSMRKIDLTPSNITSSWDVAPMQSACDTGVALGQTAKLKPRPEYVGAPSPLNKPSPSFAMHYSIPDHLPATPPCARDLGIGDASSYCSARVSTANLLSGLAQGANVQIGNIVKPENSFQQSQPVSTEFISGCGMPEYRALGHQVAFTNASFMQDAHGDISQNSLHMHFPSQMYPTMPNKSTGTYNDAQTTSWATLGQDSTIWHYAPMTPALPQTASELTGNTYQYDGGVVPYGHFH